jgi:hypothetical protein
MRGRLFAARAATLLVGLSAGLAPRADGAVAAGREWHVAPDGDDAAAGTREAPWRSLSKACDKAGPGDTVLLAKGVYRETLAPQRDGQPGRPIRFCAAPQAEVVLSGAERLEGAWKPWRGKIHALKTGLVFSQLFVDGRMMPEARWPNMRPDGLFTFARAAAGTGTGYESLCDTNLPAGEWRGAVVLIWPGDGWSADTRRVAEYRPGGSLRFDRSMKPQHRDEYHAHDPYQPREGNPYVMWGSLDGLDAPGEWFLDRGTGTVYLWMPDGDSPARHTVEVKQRDLACDLRKRSYIEVAGVELQAAGADLSDARNCLIEDCRLRYVAHAREFDRAKPLPAPNVITGTNNLMRRCLIAGSAFALLRMAGESNRLENCVLRDGSYLGSVAGGLDLCRSTAAQVIRCTLFNSGRDMVNHMWSRRIRFEYNDVYGANRLNKDAAAIYCWGTDGEGGVIAHNWVHDNYGVLTAGIYLDNFSKNFVVHHNVVWNCAFRAVILNCDALNHQVYHNTLVALPVSWTNRIFGTYTYEKHTPTMKGTRIINNLVNGLMVPTDKWQFVQGALGPEMRRNAAAAVDRHGFPVAGSDAVDAGVALPGFSDGHHGAAPDLGAYEYGKPRWTAGADWRDPDAPPPPEMDLRFAPDSKMFGLKRLEPVTDQTK